MYINVFFSFIHELIYSMPFFDGEIDQKTPSQKIHNGRGRETRDASHATAQFQWWMIIPWIKTKSRSIKEIIL